MNGNPSYINSLRYNNLPNEGSTLRLLPLEMYIRLYELGYRYYFANVSTNTFFKLSADRTPVLEHALYGVSSSHYLLLNTRAYYRDRSA